MYLRYANFVTDVLVRAEAHEVYSNTFFVTLR